MTAQVQATTPAEIRYWGTKLLSDISELKLVILVPHAASEWGHIKENYVDPLVRSHVLTLNDVILLVLPKSKGKKFSASEVKSILSTDVIPLLQMVKVDTLLCLESSCFLKLTDIKSTRGVLGQLFPITLKSATSPVSTKTMLTYSYRSYVYNPENRDTVGTHIQTLSKHLSGAFLLNQNQVLHHEEYPETLQDIQIFLDSLHQYPALTVDVETTDLFFKVSRLESIGFAWNKHSGGAFLIDRYPTKGAAIKKALIAFFERYEGKFIFSNAQFDIKQLIYNLWLENKPDTARSLDLLDLFCGRHDGRTHCTQVMTFLATNNATNNTLSLKDNAAEFMGAWAVEGINDVTKIPTAKLLRYNLEDCAASWFTFEKYLPVLEAQNLLSVYQDYWQPAIKDLTYTEICGMPLNEDRVNKLNQKLQDILQDIKNTINNNPIIKAFVKVLEQEKCDAHNARLKNKVIPLSQYQGQVPFNPASNKQLADLLYSHMGLAALSLTASGNPSTDRDALKYCLSVVKSHNNSEAVELITALIDLSELAMIISTFLPAFVRAGDVLHGNFLLGGSQSTRLSSSKVNLQNLPSTGSKYAKAVKECFQALSGELFVGCDFNALEAVVDALLTRDPMKQIIFTDGYDAHCMRAFFYFKKNMPDIAEELDGFFDGKGSVTKTQAVEIINSIKDRYPTLRQDSKPVTFALQYHGTAHTLVKNCGFTLPEAEAIVQNYKELYKVSAAWVDKRLAEASNTGFVELAFGVRLRTHRLAYKGKLSYTERKAVEAERRSAGNALTQSYGFLNSRAVSQFLRIVWDSKYRYDIKPAAQIHDASYYVIPDTFSAVKFVNDHLIKCMQWQELPELQHDTIKLGGELDLYIDWATPITVKNGASIPEIEQTVIDTKLKLIAQSR